MDLLAQSVRADLQAAALVSYCLAVLQQGCPTQLSAPTTAQPGTFRSYPAICFHFALPCLLLRWRGLLRLLPSVTFFWGKRVYLPGLSSWSFSGHPLILQDQIQSPPWPRTLVCYLLFLGSWKWFFIFSSLNSHCSSHHRTTCQIPPLCFHLVSTAPVRI